MNILGGVSFQLVSRFPPQLAYKFYFPQREGEKWSLDSFWPDDGAYSESPDINSIPGSPAYWSTGFLSIQFAIESSFAEVFFN